MEGYDAKFKAMYGSKDRKTLLKSGVEVRRVDIPNYFKDKFLVECLNFYWKYKEYGFPFSGGWAEQLNLHMDVINTIKMVDGVYGNVGLKI